MGFLVVVFFYIEKYLGTFFILLDKEGLNLNETDLINIRTNQQNMVTAYDIRETLKNIADILSFFIYITINNIS